MKKTNYLLLVFASIVFALCVSSFADENDVSLTPKQKLAANIEKYAAEKEIKDSLQASWEYHRTSPKEEWLPVWKEILLNGTLAESVTNWLDFAKVPLFFLCQVDNPTWPDDSHFLNIATDFKKLCETPDHFTLDDFVDALLKVNTDENCCRPACYAYQFFSKNEKKNAATRDSYNFSNVCLVLKFLRPIKGIERVIDSWLEELKNADYIEFRETSYENRCLGDIDSTFSGIPLTKIDDNSALRRWGKLSSIANHCGVRDSFLRGLKEAVETHSNCFPLVKFYCHVIYLDDPDAARDFLKKFYPIDRICCMPTAYPDYNELCQWLQLPIVNSGSSPSYVYRVVQWQLYSNAGKFCEWGTWFWENKGINRFNSYGKIKKKIAKSMLEGLDHHTEYTIRRLGELSDIEEFAGYLRDRLKKQPKKELAFELAVITDDPQDFEKAIDILSSDPYSRFSNALPSEKHIDINEAEVSCIIANLRDEFPASCASKILDMIKSSGIASNFDFPYYANKFSEWCKKKGETSVAAEFDKLVGETKVTVPEWKADPQKYLNEKYADTSDFAPGAILGKQYYESVPQYEWLPIWKSILVSGDLSQSVSNWLLFAKNPMQNIKDSDGIMKMELNERFRNYCSENGKFTFSEFVDALVNAPINKSITVRDDTAGVYSDYERPRRILNSLTFYQIIDVLKYLGCTNEISRVSARRGMDISEDE